MHEGWPPPDRIRWSDLIAPGSPWDPFCYEFEDVPDPDAEEEWSVDTAWLVLSEKHETPEEALARLEAWAPDYAVEAEQALTGRHR